MGPQETVRRHKGSQRQPKGSQGVLNGAKGSTKEGQKEPSGIPEGPKGTPMAPKREFKESLYTKTPDQPHQRPLCSNIVVFA